MSDYTRCEGADCNRNSRGEAYCSVCEAKIAGQEQASEDLPYALPVRVVAKEEDSFDLVDNNDDNVCAGIQDSEVAAAVAEFLNDEYPER